MKNCLIPLMCLCLMLCVGGVNEANSEEGNYEKNSEKALTEYKAIVDKTDTAMDELVREVKSFDGYGEATRFMVKDDVMGYGSVDALIKLGTDYLSKGERSQARLAFLAAIKERIVKDQNDTMSHVASDEWLVMIEGAYDKYGQGQKDVNLSEIKSYIEAIYGDNWYHPVWAWPPKAPGPRDPAYYYLRGLQRPDGQLTSKVNDKDSNEKSAKSALRTLATASETYALTKGVYPADITELLDVTPPFINQRYCNETTIGYFFQCSFSQTGYSFTAVSVGDGKKFAITTGAVLKE
jgi:hypothetical protein